MFPLLSFQPPYVYPVRLGTFADPMFRSIAASAPLYISFGEPFAVLSAK